MANSYLSRTQTAGTRTKATFSAWVKRSKLTTNQAIFGIYGAASDAGQIEIRFQGSGEGFHISGQATNWRRTNRAFQDINGWYHLVVAFDTTQSTAGDRVKVYVNGVQETSFAASGNPSQNADLPFGLNGATCVVGCNYNAGSAGDYFDGYMSHVALVDGAALTPTSFGQTDSTSGIWKFKSPSGVTWGTNGFHLKFENSANLGLDSSGQTNNLTTNGNLKQALDSPSNNHATLNELARVNNYDQRYVEHIQGNNTCQGTSTTNNGNSYSTLGVDSGKWYCEVKVNGVYNTIYPTIGYISETNANDSSHSQIGYSATGTGGYKPDGQKIINGNGASYGASFTAGDIIGVALDLDNGAIYFSKNGTFQDSGNPASGASKTGAAFTFTPDGSYYFMGASPYRSQSSLSFNFGNGTFGTTAIASAGSNGNGSLFEYDVPTGYYALNTKNINTYG
jgi:hypothetical protein